MLAVYNWNRENDRFRRVERFIQYYFDRFDTLRRPPYHPKWKEINLAANVPGWNRYWVADEMLKKAAEANKAATAATGQAPAQAIDPNLARAQAARAAPGNRAEQERLFQQFLEWSKQRPKQ